MRIKPIRHALASLTAVVLSSTAVTTMAQNRSESSILFYNEKDRIKATEAMFNLTRQLRNEFTLNLNLTYDGLTGASPTGGSPSKQPTTITRSSGGGRVVTAAGELPIDKSFNDTRFSSDMALSRKFWGATTLQTGMHWSSEHDYKSLGFNSGISQEFDEGKLTLSLSGAVTRDDVSMLGGMPDPFVDITAENEDDGERRLGRDSRRKTTYDLVAGITRVAGPKTVVRFNYSLSNASGYLTDPYKIISVVQPADSADPGEPVQNLHEKRPDRRNGNALFGQIRHSTSLGVVDGSYRYFWDNWGVISHTASLGVRFGFLGKGKLQPTIRWYQQSRADFSRPFLVQGQPLPEFASADSRLAKFSALTYGLNYDIPVSLASTLELSMEWYSQSGDPSPPESFGPLTNFDLFPDLKAVMFRIGWAHDF
jgi:hypothetical protein